MRMGKVQQQRTMQSNVNIPTNQRRRNDNRPLQRTHRPSSPTMVRHNHLDTKGPLMKIFTLTRIHTTTYEEITYVYCPQCAHELQTRLGTRNLIETELEFDDNCQLCKITLLADIH